MTDPWVRSQRYSIDIAAVSIAEFVPLIGGWVFDHAMAGWDITALVEQPDTELRPAAILGARVADLETAVVEPQCVDSYPHALLVSAVLYRRDPHIRGLVGRAMNHGDIAVFMWGGTCPPELLEQGCLTEYRCSTAGAIFKSHALRAATNQPQMQLSHTENLWALDVATRRALVHEAGSNVKAAR
jgi:hypothetical protein